MTKHGGFRRGFLVAGILAAGAALAAGAMYAYASAAITAPLRSSTGAS